MMLALLPVLLHAELFCSGPGLSHASHVCGECIPWCFVGCKERDALWTTAAGDETLRFWNVLPGPKSQSTVSDSSVTTMMRTLIR